MTKETEIFVEVTSSSCHFSHCKSNIECSDIKLETPSYEAGKQLPDS